QVREEDVISVRGMGKFRYKGIVSHTKKNRIFVLLHKYI
ncbi:MAG TPA: RNA-binding protein, partial [Lachnospiraceae bacterium]|nr:RNA-binding protein [Lachnospiraceae bacterium]